MRCSRTFLIFASALAALAPFGQSSRAAAAGLTLLYSADERGEISPCG